jgi:molybdopterin/thiamine biosynthesis adenylyltransferase
MNPLYVLFPSYTTGAETTAKLSKMKVFIYGFRSVGVETAKNLALQGVGGITVRFIYT